MNSRLFYACKDLIDDAKSECTDLVFKEICLEILNRAKQVLIDNEFHELVDYSSTLLATQSPISTG